MAAMLLRNTLRQLQTLKSANSASRILLKLPARQNSPASGGLAVFVQDSCTACIARVKDLQTQKQPFDLYFVGSQGDDETIRRWAILAGIEPTSVRNRQITLNHDAGRWLGLGLGGDLPAVVREVNGQWQRQ